MSLLKIGTIIIVVCLTIGLWPVNAKLIQDSHLPWTSTPGQPEIDNRESLSNAGYNKSTVCALAKPFVSQGKTDPDSTADRTMSMQNDMYITTEDSIEYEFEFQLTTGSFHEDDRLLDTILTDTKFTYPSELDNDQRYTWRVRMVSPEEGPWAGGAFLTPPPTFSAETDDDIPVKFELGKNYPNPFNPVTNIRYGLPVDAHVTLCVYDVLGREIITLFDHKQEAGYHHIKFDIGSLSMSTGIYLYRLEAVPADGSTRALFKQTQSMTIIK